MAYLCPFCHMNLTHATSHDARGPDELTILTGLSGDVSNWSSNDAKGPDE